jgi:hypothetical protein
MAHPPTLSVSPSLMPRSLAVPVGLTYAMSRPSGVVPSTARISDASTSPLRTLLLLDNATAPSVLPSRLPIGHSYFSSPRLRGTRLNQTGQNGPDVLHLIIVDGVTHAGIDAFGQVAAQAAKDTRRLLDSRQRNVRVHIATTNEHRRVSLVSG